MAEKVEATEEDVSGAIAWARECNHNGEMRSWIELDPAKYGCEGILWTASLILLRHLEVTQPAGWWRGRRVLEFGSGTGHMAVGLARLGAHVVATESAESHNGSLSSCYVNMVRFTTQLLARDAKKVHLFHEMFHAEQGYLAATNETIVMNIDYATRRSAPWPVPAAARLEELWQTHRDLPRPAKAGRVMGLARSRPSVLTAVVVKRP